MATSNPHIARVPRPFVRTDISFDVFIRHNQIASADDSIFYLTIQPEFYLSCLLKISLVMILNGALPHPSEMYRDETYQVRSISSIMFT
jgi:hypothetical protein